MTLTPAAVSVPFQNELQEIYWRVALSPNSIEHSNDQDLELPSEFSFKPAANVSASLERSQNEFRKWIIRNGLRDCAEALQAHFEIMFAQCLLIKYASATGKISSELYEGEYEHKRKTIHKGDISEKLTDLTNEFGLVFREDTSRCF